MNSNLTDDDYERLRRLSNELRSIRNNDWSKKITLMNLDVAVGDLKEIIQRVKDDG